MNYKEIEQAVKDIDITLPPPKNEPERQYYFIRKLREWMDEKKKDNPDTLVLDGGDFSMGTLVQTIYDSEAAELRMLGALGCEVTTLGNHEFDYRSAGLAGTLQAAKESGYNIRGGTVDGAVAGEGGNA